MDFSLEEVDVSLERRILIGCIVSDFFIKQISTLYNKEFIDNSACRKIIEWCIEYHNQYEKAPGKHIEDIIVSKEKNSLTEDEFDYISDLLGALSEEWEKTEVDYNFDFLIREAEKLFCSNSLLVLSKTIAELAKNGNHEDAINLAHNYRPVSKNSIDGINPFTDEDAIEKAFASRTEPLFTLPGALGAYMNDQLVRGGFIALQGPEKSGKSFFLQELVMRAIRSRRRVALFELGDMTQEDRLCRFHQYLAQKPFSRSKIEAGKVKVRIPELTFEGTEPVIHFKEEERRILTPDEALRNGAVWERRVGKNRVKLIARPSDTLSVLDIDNILEQWDKSLGWKPDVIAIDYAELCKPLDTRKAERSQINDTWKAMRTLSQKRNALVLTVTQSDALAYGMTSQTRKNFSEDKRKFAHVTAFYSINQTIKEKTTNTIRIGTLLIREGEDRSHKEVAVVQCLGIGRPYIDSYEVDVDFEKIKQEQQS